MIKGRKLTYLLFGFLFIVQLGSHGPVFFQNLGGLHVWRQTQTQNTINSFVEEDFNILNPRRNERGAGDGVFRMEFPLMQWITSIPIKLFGHSVLISRLMNFLFALFGFFGFFKLAGLFFPDIRISRGLAIAFWFSPVIYYYMVNPMPDNLAMAFGIWGLYYLQSWVQKRKKSHRLLSVIFFALATLVKLPYILYYAAFVWVLLFIKIPDGERPIKSRGEHFLVSSLIAAVSLIPVILWYGWVIPSWEGNGIVQGIFNMTQEQKGQYFYYIWFHLRSTLPELILGWPIAVLFITGLWVSVKRFKSGFRKYGHLFVLIIALVLFILFEMNMIEKVHDYYFMPLIPVIFLIVGLGIDHFYKKSLNRKWLSVLAVVLIAILPLYSYLRIDDRWDRKGFNVDLAAYSDELKAAVPDDALVCVGNDHSHHIFLYYVHKMGWGFENDWINAEKLSVMIQQGCRYLYCDSRHVDQNPKIRKLFGTKVAEFGSVKVFKLVLPEELSGL